MTGQPLGPFPTSGDALLAVLPADGSFVSREALLAVLEDTMQAAGVELGEWDREVLSWLSGLDAQTVAAVAGWVGRAHEAGMAVAPASVVPPAEAGAPVVGLLRSAADALDVALATWEARDPRDPSPEARRARGAMIATTDAVTTVMARLRARLGGSRS